MPETKTVGLKKLNRVPVGDVGYNQLSFSVDSGLEYLAELQGSQGSMNYLKMSTQDAQVGMILNVFKNPIKSANWCFPLPDDATPEEEKAIDVLNQWFFKDKINSFDRLLCQIISMIEYGFSSFERVWNTMPFDGAIYYVPDLQQRFQPSVENINVDKGIVQQTTVSKGLVDIPLDTMVFFTLNQQGNDLRGQSILRHAYQNWKDKNRYRVFQGIGIQRSQTGIPWMEVPETTNTGDADYIACETLLKNITTHENAYMITKTGFTFDIKAFKNDPEKIQLVIDKLDEKMAISVLAQFVLLGTGGGGGAYALSRDQSDMFLDGLNYIVSFIENKFHATVLRPFVELNFGDSVDLDKIRLKGLNLNKKAGAELATTLQQLNASGFIKATIDDEIQMRKFLELPELSDDELEIRKARQADPLMQQQPQGQPGINPEENEENKKEENKTPVKLSEPKASERVTLIRVEEKQMIDLMRANLLLIKDKLVADIKAVLNRGSVEINGLKAIEVNWSKYSKSLERKLAGIANMGWSQAKKQAKVNKIKLSEPLDVSKLDNKALQAYVKNEAEIIAEDQVVSMKIRAIGTASSSNLKGHSNAQTLSNVEKVIDDFFESQKMQTGASLIVVGGFNFGEQQFYKEVEDQIWGYEFIAVDDDRTSEICQWYNGKTFSINSSESSIANPPLHPNCRSHLRPLWKSEMQDKPKIDDQVAPPSVMKGKSIY